MTQDVDRMDELFTDLGSIVKAADYSEALRNFMPELASQHAQMFEAASDSDGTEWAPLKPSTIKEKAQDHILFKTGALENSLVHVGASGNVNQVGPKEMLFGTHVEYASDLQDGTRHMPARPPVGMPIETLDKLCQKIADATIEMLRG